jgi:hypothetical protein
MGQLPTRSRDGPCECPVGLTGNGALPDSVGNLPNLAFLYASELRLERSGLTRPALERIHVVAALHRAAAHAGLRSLLVTAAFTTA